MRRKIILLMRFLLIGAYALSQETDKKVESEYYTAECISGVSGCRTETVVYLSCCFRVSEPSKSKIRESLPDKGLSARFENMDAVKVEGYSLEQRMASWSPYSRKRRSHSRTRLRKDKNESETLEEIIEEEPIQSIIANSDESQIKVFPIPTSDVITITGVEPNAVVHLFSQSGKRVMATQTRSNTAKLELHELTSGVYFVKVKSGEDWFTERVVVSH